jgi:DNA-directed RNA polymerase
MRQKLKQHIQLRLNNEISSRNSLKYLKDIDIDSYLDEVLSIVYLYTRVKKGPSKTIIFTELICAIGHAVRGKLRQKKNTSVAAKTGAFFIWSLEDLGVLTMVLSGGANGHNQYAIEIVDDEAIISLWETVTPDNSEKLPSLTPYAPWTKVYHDTGMPMVKTGSKDVLSKITLETHPILFDCLNKAQSIGWTINQDVYQISQWALRNKTDAFSDIWEQTSPEAKATKLREARAISDIARRVSTETFYHLYYYDFRGRKYPTSAYLHEQGSDFARGLLLRSDAKPIGRDGFFWLLVSIASNWAGDSGRSDGTKTDKIPLRDRYLWAIDNEEILLSYAESPKVNQGWMKADKPWQFLAACIELMKFRVWQMTTGDGTDDYSFSSHLECYVDGSNNGSQHLSALTADHETAPHVNLVPSELPGDLYAYIAVHVWTSIDSIVKAMEPSLVKQCKAYIATLIDMKKAIQQTEVGSEIRKTKVAEMKQFKEQNAFIAEHASAVFWHGITDSKQRRKVVKRNVMTLPYGGTRYGLGQQQIDDAKKHGIERLYHMEHKWAAYMGRMVFDVCKEALRRPMQLLTVFEEAGKIADANEEFLEWTVPITNFSVMQYYTEGKVVKTWVQYGPPIGRKLANGYYENALQLNLCYIENQIPSKGKQAQGAAPNVIHSLDAGHLALTVYRAPFGVTTIHDSFGCLLADMPALFTLVRQTFVEFYDTYPLADIMESISGDISDVEFGTLDVSLVLDSEYCFA